MVNATVHIQNGILSHVSGSYEDDIIVIGLVVETVRRLREVVVKIMICSLRTTVSEMMETLYHLPEEVRGEERARMVNCGNMLMDMGCKLKLCGVTEGDEGFVLDCVRTP